MVKRLLHLSLPIAFAIAVSSCDKADLKVSGLIAAKVNGEEISVHQVYDVLARSDNNIPPEQAGREAAQVLERIIDQDLLAQKAIEAKLDRDPKVTRAIEITRRQILGQAYVAKTAGTEPGSSAEEISAFYRQNPALFENRRNYRMHELAVVVPWEKLDALQAEAARARTLYDVAVWLESRNIAFNVARTTRATEQLPFGYLHQLSKMEEGQIAVVPAAVGVSVIQLLQSTEAPVSEQQATPIIERYLLNRKRFEVAQAEVRKLRERARIEYGGGFEPPQLAQSAPAARARPLVAVPGMTSASTAIAGPR